MDEAGPNVYTPPYLNTDRPSGALFRPHHPWLWPVVGLVGAVLLLYLPALRAGFIWDDDVHFVANPRMSSWAGLWEIWTSRWALYYPLTSTTFWVLRRFIGLVPWAYHLFNILMHAGAAVLLWRVLAGFNIRGAWLGAFLFAIHPVQVETVAWISELKNTQSLVLLLLSLLALQKSGLLHDRRLLCRRAYGWSLAWFFLALMSKSSVATFPAVLLVLAAWKQGWRSWTGWGWILPFFLPSLLFAGWTIWEQRVNSGAVGFEWDATLLDRLVTSGRLVIFYFNKLLWPDPLIFIYPSFDLQAHELRAWMPLLALVVVALGLLFNLRNGGAPLLAAMLCYLLFLFPVLGFFNIYFMRYAGAADHLQYLASTVPMAVLGAVLAEVLAWLRDKSRGAAVSERVVVALGAIVWALLAQRHVGAFQNNESLWRDTVAKNPGAWMAQNNLGLLYLDRGEWEPAARHLRAALAVNPRHYEALNNLGTILFRLGDWVGARSSFERALALQPRLVVAWSNLGSVHEKLGQSNDAERCYREAITRSPGLREAHARLAALCESSGRVPEALEQYRLALQASTTDVKEHAKFIQQRAAHLLGERRWSDAQLFMEEAERLAPGDPVNLQLREAMRRLENEP